MLPRLIECLDTDTDEIRYASISTLSASGHHARAAIPVLRRLLGSNDAHLRLFAAVAITKVGEESEDHALVLVLREGLVSANWDESRMATAALAAGTLKESRLNPQGRSRECDKGP